MIDKENNKLNKFKIILASQSERRYELMKGMGFSFDVKVKPISEVFPENLINEEIAVFLAENKANAFDKREIDENTIIITADTIVCYDKMVLNKPKDKNEAYDMIRLLSGKEHNVITGVCLKSALKTNSFYSNTKVFFRDFTDAEIHYYIDNYEPYDKAGSYGIQEWIGIVGVKRIEGSYFNVMGLPTQELYLELLKFAN